MVNVLTNLGEQIMLMGNAPVTPTDGGLARLAVAVRLFKSTSVPNKDGTGFVEVDNGNGYVSGGQAVVLGNWTFSVVVTNGQIQLVDKSWTAVGGNISNVAGAYLVDAGGNALAWWERTTPVTLLPGDTITLDDLIVRQT